MSYNWAKMNRAAAEVLAAVDITNISPTKKVSDLNFATRQMVEIAKVMNVTKQSGSEHCLILLDEPTSVLNEAEVENLYKQMRKIAAQGHASSLFPTTSTRFWRSPTASMSIRTAPAWAAWTPGTPTRPSCTK